MTYQFARGNFLPANPTFIPKTLPDFEGVDSSFGCAIAEQGMQVMSPADITHATNAFSPNYISDSSLLDRLPELSPQLVSPFPEPGTIPQLLATGIEPPSSPPNVQEAIDEAIANTGLVPSRPIARNQVSETARMLVWCEACELCGKQFFKQGSLIRHIRAAHRTGRRRNRNIGERLCCPKCPKTFSQQGSLNRHLRSIHESRKLQCKYCNLSFGQAFDLKRHQRRKHPHDVPFVPRAAMPTQMRFG